MLQALIGPVAELAGGWLKGKASAQAASANLKLVEAEAKATIMKSAATSEGIGKRLWPKELKILGKTSILCCFSPFH